MANVRFEDVTKRFGDVTAVDQLSFEVEDGEFVVLVGPSGSGKTTALRLLAGLEAMTGGEISIGGRVVNNVAPRDRELAMVFQDYALYPQMSVHDNLAFGLKTRKVPRAEIETRIDDAAGALGLEALLRRKPRELSGGQRQRVALGRALVRRPQVFLMDEPLSNLDASLRVNMRGEIKRLQREVGTTTVFVTHDQVEAMTMGDRILVMRDGRLEQVAEPTELYEAPSNSFVARFVGSPGMSLVQARIDGDRLAVGDQQMTIPVGALESGEVVIGVRPEDAVLWRPDAGDHGPLTGMVAFVEDLGREALVGVRSGEGDVTLSITGRVPVQLGDSISIGLRRGRVYVFDSGTGVTLGRL